MGLSRGFSGSKYPYKRSGYRCRASSASFTLSRLNGQFYIEYLKQPNFSVVSLLHNVTAIERMLIQLEETERSFDAFWARHEKRLMQCLQLRRFEDSFRKTSPSLNYHYRLPLN
uniref:Uncharacterized protein n=1 Tax=Syphacia muris TaxID=451379 RepID=A0A0N5ADL4_9BILA